MSKYKKYIFISTLMLILVLIVPTYSWLSSSKNVIFIANSGSMTCSLVKVDTTSSPNYTHTPNYVIYNASATFDENNQKQPIDIQIKCNVKTNIEAYIRIKVLDEWVRTRHYESFNRTDVEVINHEDIGIFPFTLGNNWYYDQNTKYCYYKEKLDSNSSLSFITSADSIIPRTSYIYVESYELKLSFRVEMVQSNRFEEVWGISSIPGV